MTDLDPQSAQWAGASHVGAVDVDIVENAGDAPAPTRDRSMDAAAPHGTDDGSGWGARAPGGGAAPKRKPAPHEIVPVALVQEHPAGVIERAPDNWSVASGGVTADPARLLGKQESRRSLAIINTGTKTVYLAPDPNLLSSPANGLAIAAGSSISMEHRGQVYACCAAGDTTTVTLVVTFDEAAT